MKTHLIATIRGQRYGAGLVEAMILDVDIHQVRCKLAEGIHAVGLAAEHEVGRLVDEAEVGLADSFEVGEDLLDRFKNRRGVALVRQTNTTIRRGGSWYSSGAPMPHHVDF